MSEYYWVTARYSDDEQVGEVYSGIPKYVTVFKDVMDWRSVGKKVEIFVRAESAGDAETEVRKLLDKFEPEYQIDGIVKVPQDSVASTVTQESILNQVIETVVEDILGEQTTTALTATPVIGVIGVSKDKGSLEGIWNSPPLQPLVGVLTDEEREGFIERIRSMNPGMDKKEIERLLFGDTR